MDPNALAQHTSANGGSRRNEDIALDLMKFIALQTEMGRPGGVGFTSSSSKSAGDDQTERFLALYTRCLSAVEGKK